MTVKIDTKNCFSMFLNEVLIPLYRLEDTIEIPRLHVKGIQRDETEQLGSLIQKALPSFLVEHSLHENVYPAAREYSVQFSRRLEGVVVDIIHLFTVDLRFSGNSSTAIEKGSTEFYPSYMTNRIYASSELVPVVKNSDFPQGIARISSGDIHQSDQYFHTFAIFDELDRREETAKILENIGIDEFPVSTKLYPFFEYNYMTAIMREPFPEEDRLKESLRVFEPVFLRILATLTHDSRLLDQYCLHTQDDFTDDKKNLSSELVEKLQKHMAEIAITRDDELALKRWWSVEKK